MKSQIFYTLLILFFSSQLQASELSAITFDACPGVKVSTSNGITVRSFPSSDYFIDTIYISKIDSMDIDFSAGGGCYINPTKVTIDGKEANYIQTAGSYYHPQLRMLAVPGNYRVFALVGSAVPNQVEFTLIYNAVGIAETALDQNEIEIYPLPATSEVFIKSINSEIEVVEILTSSGIVSCMFNPNTKIARIPLETYTSGLYFVRVKTKDKKIRVKKLTIR